MSVREPIEIAMDVAYAGLKEVDPELADSIKGYEDEAGFYLECDEWILSTDEWAMIDKAETLARQVIGQGPRQRG